MSARTKMYSWDLMQVDDLCKCVALDPYIGFGSRKVNKISILPKDVMTKLKDTLELYNPVNKNNVKELTTELIKLIEYYKLRRIFNIQFLKWIELPLQHYLQAQSSESLIIIQECNRYKEDNYKGVMVIAKVSIKKHTKLNFLTGIYKEVNLKTQSFLESQKFDFSVMKSCMNNNDVILLGPAASVNHDCSPNCKYYSMKKGFVCIITTQNIQVGEELYCDYGPDYFGTNNEECSCKTCERKNHGCFSKKNIESSLNYEEDTNCDYIKINSNYDLDHFSFKTFTFGNAFVLDHTFTTSLNVIMFSFDLVHVINLLQHLVMSSDNRFNNIAVYRNSISMDNFQLALLILLYIYQILQNISAYNDDNFDNNLMGLNDIIDTNTSSRFSIEEVDSKDSLENESVKESATSKVQPTFYPEPNVVQWCLKCYKGAMYDIHKKWHDSDCFGRIETGSNSIPRVLLTYPEEIPKKRRPYCQFCASFVHQYARHLRSKHFSEPKVIEMLDSQSHKEKMNLLSSMRNRGYNVYFKFTGKIIPCKSVRKGASDVVKVECRRCGGFFSKSTLWCHVCPN